MYDAVAIGELLIDFMVERQLDDGYPVMAARPGGAPANFLAALSKFGRKTGMISKVGDDALGRRLVATAEEVGIDTRGIVVSGDVFTTLAFVTRDRQGEREFSFARKPGADTTLSASEVDFSLIDETRVLHFGTVGMTDEPSRTAHRDAVVYASEKGKLITFDPNLRRPLWRSLDDAREQMLWGFDYADVVKVSDSEIAFLFGCSVEEGGPDPAGAPRRQPCVCDAGKGRLLFLQSPGQRQRACAVRHPGRGYHRRRRHFLRARQSMACWMPGSGREPCRWRRCAGLQPFPARRPACPRKRPAALGLFRTWIRCGRRVCAG